MNHVEHITYNTASQIRFKTSMLRSSLCDYSDAYILLKENIAVANIAAAGQAANNDDKKELFKNCASFISCVSRINKKQIEDAQSVDLIIPMYNLIK